MVRLLTVAFFVFTLFPAAVALVNACSETTEARSDASAVQRRFQTNFCYKQYRSQSDVARCLSGAV